MLGCKFVMLMLINGFKCVIVLFGGYEQVVLFDIVFIYFLKVFVVGDVECVEEFGVFEFEEDDLVFCMFVCFGKIDYGFYLCDVLIILEKEG